MLNRYVLGKLLAVCVVAVVLAGSTFHGRALAQSKGRADLDQAMQQKITVEGLQGLNQVIVLLQSALDKGLEVEDAEFAEVMLSDALMERATTLIRVVNSQSILNPKVQEVRRRVVSDLRSVLAYDNPLPQAYLMLGQMMGLPGGDSSEARRALTSYLESEGLTDEQKAEALVLRARVQTNEAKVIADINQAIELAPENANFRLVRAALLHSQKKFEEALSELGQVLAETPDDANALILQGEVFRKLEMYDEAIKSFEQATEHAPESPTPYQNRGEIYREQEEFEKAIAQFNKVLELQPGALRALLFRAESYLYAGKLEEALVDVDVVIEKHADVTAHRIRAEIMANMNRLSDAIDEMEHLAEAMPERLDLKLQVALYYLVNEQPRQAIAAYSDVIAKDPFNFLALRSRGDAYLNIGQHAAAVADLEKALNLQPDDPAILNNLAWVLATSPDDPVRDGKRAVELATKACEVTNYEKSHILSTLAAAHAELGDFDEAAKWSQQAVDMNDPEHIEQLTAELESYRQSQPWREKQSAPDKDEPTEKATAEPAAEPAADQELPAADTTAPEDDSVDF